jgi:hypothetical protein
MLMLRDNSRSSSPSTVPPAGLRDAGRRPVPDVRNRRMVPAMLPAHLGQRRADLLLRRADAGHDLTHGEAPVAADRRQGRVPRFDALFEGLAQTFDFLFPPTCFRIGQI